MPQAAQLCANCHAQTLDQQATPDAQLTPLLGHQQAQYLENALISCARRQCDHFFMRGVAAGLSRDQLDEVVRYFSSALPATARPEVAAHDACGRTALRGLPWRCRPRACIR
jgi:cytochrome c553